MRSVGRAFGIGAREMHVHALTKVAGAVAAAMAVGVSGCGPKTTAASPDTAGMNGELLAGLEREQPAAPPEIADTVTALIAELGLVRQLNATYTTDLEAIQAQLLPTLAAAPQASDRYEAYGRDNCGGQ